MNILAGCHTCGGGYPPWGFCHLRQLVAGIHPKKTKMDSR